MTNRLSTEDTMIGMQPSTRENTLLADFDGTTPADDSMIERCRALFRTVGQRMSSFDLSRQIYG